MTTTDRNTDMIHHPRPEQQAAIRRRLDEIWAACAARDFDRLESFHLYGPAFTAFKDGAPRDDAAANAAGERATFSALEAPKVDMRDLAVHVYGDVGIATFNGHFDAAIHGSAVTLDQQATMVLVQENGEWRIVHEHFSPLAAAADAPASRAPAPNDRPD